MKTLHHYPRCKIALALSFAALSASAFAENCSTTPTSGGTYYFINKGSGQALDVNTTDTSTVPNVMSYEYWGGTNQQFVLTKQSDNYWEIKSIYNSKLLEVLNASTSNGANVDTYSDWDGDNQRWELKVQSGGGFKIVNKNSQHSLTVAGSSNGSNVYQNEDASLSSQRWYINPVSGSCGDSSSSSGSSSPDTSSSSAAPTADAARMAGANSEPLTNGYPSFITSVKSDATVVSTLAGVVDAINNASAGDVIYIREGTYYPSDTIKIQNSGTSTKAIVLSVYPGDDRPVFDFSAMSESSSNRGFQVSANYWHIYGFDITKAGDNGMYLTGSHNTIEFMEFYENSDTGLQISSGGAYNFIKNSDSYYNADSSLENADGFAAKLTVGTGNYFYGCRAWNNLDDGFDGYLRDNGSSVTTTLEYTWMIRNGYQKNGVAGSGDGNGFKTGGSDDKNLAHNGLYINTISAGNTADGYDQNSNRGTVTIYNAIAYNNARNFGLGDGSSRELKKLTLNNSVSLGGGSSDKFGASSTSIKNNSWQNSLSFSSSDFESVDINNLLAARQSDGSLPVVKFFHLKSGSKLIDAGTDVGLDYNGNAPDLGSFESE
ncbi:MULTISPECIES: RICIN domain-containing protein [Vibrio]|uniref:RICIN domain-containing protein n=1 Tax=Vibrio ostreae TaxID=2841925 RepID=A0A975U775_9VIBR|nr:MULTISPECIES: RICIN domain-containing protein [Vibrio]QXO15536.1 RICIN domain-containing protein [Vibrio ostreae]WGY45484.1 RICIN domain-containing protein [Vibrio sp. ABG19]